MQIDHIGIEVEDLFEMERFYRSVLGFLPRYRYVSTRTNTLRTVFLERGGMAIELLERPREASFAHHRRQAPNHVALQVDDVDAAYQRIIAAAYPGVTIGAPRDTGDGYREAELRDPEGNVVELAARVRPAPDYPVRAVIFDLDGTLVDSEPNYYLADRALLARYGIAFSIEDKQRYIGRGNLQMMRDLVERFGLPVTPEDLAREKNALYLELAERGTQVFPAMRRFLSGVLADRLPVAIASGSAPHVLGRVLQAVGLTELFPHVVSAEEVPRGKPAPDVFLEAARRLGVPPHTCVVVEDAAAGVEAAHRAFMRCIAVPTVPTVKDAQLAATFDMADLVYPDGMHAFDPDHALAWVRERLATTS